MGFSHSWVALKSADKVGFLEHLGLAEDGPGDLDDALNGFGLADLARGWLLVLCNDLELPAEIDLAELSQRGEVVACAISERVMFSEARGFRDGEPTWLVTHDSSKSRGDLRVEGEPPEFASVHAKVLAEQAEGDRLKHGVDYVFDAPPFVAKSVCGFELGLSEPDFIRLRRTRLRAQAAGSDGRPGFFQRLFGRQ